SSAMEKTQRQIMLFMPLFFVVFIISFPAGVILYWITTNSWTILQQYIVKKRVGQIAPVAAAAAGSPGKEPGTGGSGRGGGGGGPRPDAGPNGAGSGGLA